MAPFIPAPWLPPAECPADARQRSRQTAARDLVRVRRGLYLPAAYWAGLKPWERFRQQVQAVNDSAVGEPPVFALETAAHILGMNPPFIPAQVQTLIRGSATGGRSRNGICRVVGVKGDPDPWIMDGLLVTPPIETARDIAAHRRLGIALPVMDRLIRPQLLAGVPNARLMSPPDVVPSIERLKHATHRARATRVLDLANGASESAGESLSRAIMILNGFPLPRLQNAFFDSKGLIGYSDFDWKEQQTVGEFDGHGKYKEDQFLNSRTPGEVVVREKRREDRLRALGLVVVRWEWEDLVHPERLVATLRRAGLDQRRRR
ncbi:hypothetical protein [Specibacter cremeus]|uniref:hypothetical protein n=1 Tax=Specibacter cremeus TaxID=1629051 RepID=UPI000F7A57DC|nr:hypothetical protein [Specibacter cremeus]